MKSLSTHITEALQVNEANSWSAPSNGRIRKTFATTKSKISAFSKSQKY